MTTDILIQRFTILLENLQTQVIDFIDFLTEKYVTDLAEINEEKQEEISQEIKDLLDSRIANYEKNPQNVKSWEEIEKRLLKKYNYAI